MVAAGKRNGVQHRRRVGLRDGGWELGHPRCLILGSYPGPAWLLPRPFPGPVGSPAMFSCRRSGSMQGLTSCARSSLGMRVRCCVLCSRRSSQPLRSPLPTPTGQPLTHLQLLM